MGGCNSRLQIVWNNMKQRCYNSKHPQAAYYLHRGITVCPEWYNSFLTFKTWALQNGYQRGLSLDRIDNYKGYSPDNCRWVTRKVSNTNTRNRKYYTAFGETKTVTDWANDPRCLVKRNGLQKRIDMGVSIEQALTLTSRVGLPLRTRKEQQL